MIERSAAAFLERFEAGGVDLRVEHQRGKAFASVQGAGFGLYLCRQIVEAHGGAIRCEGNGEIPGTTIAFELMVEEGDLRPEGGAGRKPMKAAS